MRLALSRRAHAWRAALLAALAACSAIPVPVAAQGALRPNTFEPYVSRARLTPSVLGAPARVSGMGARLLAPVAPGDAPDRLRAGGYLTYAPADGRGVTTTQVGAVADLRLRERPVAGRVEPLLSLGVGAFRTRWGPAAPSLRPSCLAPLDAGAGTLGAASPGRCLGAGRAAAASATHLAVSPALAARVDLLPGVALRVDARDLVVYRGAPRHNFELTTGLSLTR